MPCDSKRSAIGTTAEGDGVLNGEEPYCDDEFEDQDVLEGDLGSTI